MCSLTVLIFKILVLQMWIAELWWEFWKIVPNYCPIFLDDTLGQPFTQFTLQVWSVTFLVVACTWLHEDVILMDKWERKRISLPNSKNHWTKKNKDLIEGLKCLIGFVDQIAFLSVWTFWDESTPGKLKEKVIAPRGLQLHLKLWQFPLCARRLVFYYTTMAIRKTHNNVH